MTKMFPVGGTKQRSRGRECLTLTRLRFVCPVCRKADTLWRDYRRDKWGDYRHYDHCETCGGLGWDAAIVGRDDTEISEVAR